MANTLGALVVKLGLDAAEFTSGLTKSEYQAQKFANKLDAQFKSVARTIAGLGVGAAIGLFVRDMVSSAAALDDLADATGSSVESLSKLANQAKISGRDFGGGESVMLKLAAGMAGADDESSNTGRALAALGVTARDPAEALQQIALALNKYADGVGKAAIARDLFGKSGPAFLATLKDIAETQDVAATTSTKMAADAEALEKALRRLTVEGTALKDVILGGLVPWLNTMLEQFREGIKLAGGFGEALRTLGTINPFKSAADNIADANERLAALKAGTGAESFFSKIFGTTDEVKRRLELVKAFEQLRQRQQAMAGAADFGYTGDVRDYLASRKPTLAYTGANAKGGGSSGKEPKQSIADYADEIRHLNDEMFKAAGGDGGYTHLIAANEKFQKDLEAGKIINLDQVRTLMQTAQAADEQAISIKAAADAWKVYDEELKQAAEIEKRATDAVGGFAEQLDAFEKSIGIIGKGAKAYDLLNAEIEHNKRLKLATADTVGIENAQYERQKKLIEVYHEANDALQQQIEYNRIFTDSFADALTSVVDGTKSVSQAFRDMEHSIVQAISRIAAQKIAEQIFGVGAGGGGGIGAMFAGLFGSGASAGTGIGFPTAGFASGTNYAPGGAAWVGEHGPEIVNLPRGAQVIPFDKAKRAGGSVTVNVMVPGGTSRASADQIAQQTGIAVGRAMRRNS